MTFNMLEHITQQVKESGRGVAMIHVTKSGMEAWKIPLPPLDEQKRIAAILDKADGLRRKRRQAIELLDTLTQSIFVEMFGDPVSGMKLVELSELVRDGDRINYGVVQPGEEDENGVPLIRGTDIRHGSVDHAQLRTVSNTVNQRHSKSILKGD